MSHRLNCEPSGSKKILELRQPRKVMERQHWSGRELPVGDRPSGDYIYLKKGKINSNGLLMFAMNPATV